MSTGTAISGTPTASIRSATTKLPSPTSKPPVSERQPRKRVCQFPAGPGRQRRRADPQDPQYRKMSWSLFIQDDWKITAKLTLNYGLRWTCRARPTKSISALRSFPPHAEPAVGGLLEPPYMRQRYGTLQLQLCGPRILCVGRASACLSTNAEDVLAPVGSHVRPLVLSYLSNTSILGEVPSAITPSPLCLRDWHAGCHFRGGLPYTQAQLYPTTLSAGIVPSRPTDSPLTGGSNGARPRASTSGTSDSRELTKDW